MPTNKPHNARLFLLWTEEILEESFILSDGLLWHAKSGRVIIVVLVDHSVARTADGETPKPSPSTGHADFKDVRATCLI